jgi:muramoyltetrapeptide carboxypeptidase LdcA involved in peptidoglycan recycling
MQKGGIKMKTTFNGTPLMDLFDKLPKINEEVNKENIKIFRQYGITYSGELRHTCVLCGKKVNIEGSVSSYGHRLICTQCVHKYFEGDYSAVSEWNKER